MNQERQRQIAFIREEFEELTGVLDELLIKEQEVSHRMAMLGKEAKNLSSPQISRILENALASLEDVEHGLKKAYQELISSASTAWEGKYFTPEEQAVEEQPSG